MKTHLLTVATLVVFMNSVHAQVNRYSQSANQALIHPQRKHNLGLIHQVVEPKEADPQVAACKKQTVEQYLAAAPYPPVLMDGVHTTQATAPGLCGTRKVWVKDNQPVSIVHEDESTASFTFSTPIKHGKCLAKTTEGTGAIRFYNLYFIEDASKK